MGERSFDVVVIGAGPGGEAIAGMLADAGREVAIVENRLVGGECSYWACMPSKALARPPELHAELERVPGVPGASGALDVQAVLDRRDEVVHGLDDDAQLPWLRKRDIALLRGQGRLDGERRVRVGDELLHARDAVVVAVGTAPEIPPIEGLREAAVWTNREITVAREVPERLLIVGAGPVGLEMAFAWRALGSSVALIEVAETLLGRYEPFCGELVSSALAERGVEVHVGATVREVRQGERQTQVQLAGGQQLHGTHLLVATGRRPLTDDLGLAALALEPGAHVPTDERLRVPGHPWLYAVGDINGRTPLTHMAKYQARIAATNILGGDARLSPAATPPQVIFTEPQIASVGHTLASAQRDGIDAEAVDAQLSMTAGGSFVGKGAADHTRFVVDRERDVLVGVTMAGPHVVEMIHAATIAVVGAIPRSRLADAVPSFPTRSEIWLQVLHAPG